MGMFDNVGNLTEDAASTNYKMPLGDHAALITEVTPDEEKGVVDFKINFNGTTVSPRGRFWLVGDDPVKVKKGHAMIAKQMKNVHGVLPRNGAELQRAIMALEGKSVVVEVTPRKGSSDYQNYWLKGPYVADRGASVANVDDGDLPF